MSKNSRIPRFYKLSIEERVKAMRENGWMDGDDYNLFFENTHTLDIQKADKMIENVIGVMGLPIGLGLNFLINDKDYVVPLVVEEPSIVAALSSAAKIVRSGGGFTTDSDESLLIGQVQLVNVPNPARAKAKLLERKQEILDLANSLHPKMVARGGGARDIEILHHTNPGQSGDMMVVHLLASTCDAMGANLINTMCEGIAPLIERITGGRVFLRILSNLTDRSLVRAKCIVPTKALEGKGYSGEDVRDGIIAAAEFASIDPYRAATHNKGIMNGIDAVVLATGNDWRAIEAGAHAYAARGSHYTSLTKWYKNEQGDLVGEIEIPIKVGIVGGPLESNPTVAVHLRMMKVQSATELAEVMAAVGLAQNFSAIKALATDGIQQGHMTLHARTVTQAAGATDDIFDIVVEKLIEAGEIKVWKAKEIVKEMQTEKKSTSNDNSRFEATEKFATGHGKVILLGEHAVVYGAHAVAAPVPLAVQCEIKPSDKGVEIAIPNWGVDYILEQNPKKQSVHERPIAGTLKTLGLENKAMRIELFSNLGRAMGMGGSAAVAVAIIRALNIYFDLSLSDEKVNELAYESEKFAHGNPSGIDNTVATYGKPLLFERGNPPKIETIDHIGSPLHLVIGITGVESLTASMVEKVAKLRDSDPKRYDDVFEQINQISLEGIKAIQEGNIKELGHLMNVNHGLLNILEVSCPELEEIVQIARDNNALGAKITGAGGGGSALALCSDKHNAQTIKKAIENAGYQAVDLVIGE